MKSCDSCLQLRYLLFSLLDAIEGDPVVAAANEEIIRNAKLGLGLLKGDGK